MNKEEKINRRFIGQAEEVFEQRLDSVVEDNYHSMVESPFYEREMVEAFERSVEYGD